MNPIILTTFVASISIAIPIEAAEQDKNNRLERRILDLEKRVSKLEAISKGAPQGDSRGPTSSNWKDLKNWRQLRVGMSYDEVRTLLGEPEKIEGGNVAFWYWDNRRASVGFISEKLYSWSEP